MNTTFLGHGDLVAGATSVSGSGTWNPAITAIQDRRLQKIARASSAVGIVEIVFTALSPANLIAVLNTNADPSTSTWEAFSDTGFSVSVASGAFVDYGLGGAAVATPNIYALMSQTANLRVRSLRLSLSTNGDDLYIGRGWCSPIFYSAQGAQFGTFRRTVIDPSTVVRALDSTPYVTERRAYRRGSVTFHAMTEAESETQSAADGTPYVDCLYAVELANGTNTEMILLPNYDPNGVTVADSRLINAQAIYGLAEWGETEQFEKSGGGWLYRKTLTMTESV